MNLPLRIWTCSLFLLAIPALAACNKPVEPTDSGEIGAEEASPADTPADSTADTPADDDSADGGKTANPARPTGGPPVPELTWEDAPLELAFPTGAWQVFFGQGMCMPKPACQGLKAVRGEEELALDTRADLAKVVPLLEDKDQALAMVRFLTDRRYIFSDESCQEADVGDDGAVKFFMPKDLDLEAPPTSTPPKVVDFEGGFRVERTLLCRGDETDKLVHVAETVFIEGHMEREDVQVLIEHPGLVPRLR